MHLPYKIRRIDNIDGTISKKLSMLLKGLSCVLVGLHHYARIAVEQHGSTNIFYILLASQGGNVGVGVFFFLSGYGLMESAKKRSPSIREIIIKRYWKLLWPLLVLNILYLVICRIQGSIIFDSPHALIWAVADFKSVDPVLWFIEILFACYAVFYISLRVGRERQRDWLMYSMGALLILFFMLTRNELHWHYTNIPMFFLGVFYSQHRNRITKRMRLIPFICLCSAVLLATAIGWFLFHLMWARLGVCITVLAGLLLFARHFVLDVNGKTYLGEISYEYYLSHNKLLMQLGGVNIILFLIASILLAFVLNRIFSIPAKTAYYQLNRYNE